MNHMTHQDFAAAIGVSDNTLRRLRRRDDWPAAVPRTMPRAGYATRHVATVKAWRESLQEDRNADGASAGIRRKKDLEAMLMTRLKRRILSGQYVRKRVHVAAMERITDVFVAKLNQAEQSIPLTVPNLTPEQRGDLERAIAETFAAMRSDIAERGWIEIPADAAEDCDRVGVGR